MGETGAEGGLGVPGWSLLQFSPSHPSACSSPHPDLRATLGCRLSYHSHPADLQGARALPRLPPHPCLDGPQGWAWALPGSEALGAGVRLSRRSWPCRTGRGSRSSGTRSAGGKEGRDQPQAHSFWGRGGGLALPFPRPQQQSATDLSPLPSPPHKRTKLAHAIGYKIR